MTKNERITEFKAINSNERKVGVSTTYRDLP